MGLNTGLNIGSYTNGLAASYPQATGVVQNQPTMNYNTPLIGGANYGTGGLFPSTPFNGFTPTTDYSNDIMFPPELAMNYNQFAAPTGDLAQTQGQTQDPSQTQATTFTGNDSYTNQTQIEAAMAQNPNLRVTKNGNLYTVTNTGKKSGVFAGVTIPLVRELYKAFKGGSFTKAALNLKALAIKVPVFAVIGWGIGALADKFLNSYSAKAADAQGQAAQQPLSLRA